MDVRRVADAILRASTSSTLTPLLTPSIRLPIRSARPSVSAQPSTRPRTLALQPCSRTFSTANPLRAQAAAPREEEAHERNGPAPNSRLQSGDTSTSSQQQQQQQQQPLQSSRNADSDLNDELNSLVDERLGSRFLKGKPRNRQQPSASSPAPNARAQSQGSNASGRADLDAMLRKHQTSMERSLAARRLLDVGDMGGNTATPAGTATAAKINERPVQLDLGSAPFRINASLGRTVDIVRGRVDLARAVRQLDMKCRANNVRRDEARQRFHERAGQKRKRLHSERWRRRFKRDFQNVVRRVEELKRKGW